MMFLGGQEMMLWSTASRFSIGCIYQDFSLSFMPLKGFRSARSDTAVLKCLENDTAMTCGLLICHALMFP